MNKCKLNYCLKEKSSKETDFPENKNFLVYLLKKLSNKKKVSTNFFFRQKKTMKGWASTRANYKGIFFENSTFVKFVFCCCCYNSVYLRSPENICKGWEKMCHWPYPTESNCGLSVSAVPTLSLSPSAKSHRCHCLCTSL